MIELYRIVDVTTDSIVAESVSSYEQAYETLSFYEVDYPTHKFEIETYHRSSVKSGFGRDPDLH